MCRADYNEVEFMSGTNARITIKMSQYNLIFACVPLRCVALCYAHPSFRYEIRGGKRLCVLCSVSTEGRSSR